MSDAEQYIRVNESALHERSPLEQADESLLIGGRMTFRERLEWNEVMVGLWARWHPDLARRVWIERESIR